MAARTVGADQIPTCRDPLAIAVWAGDSNFNAIGGFAVTLVHAAAVELDPLARFELIPQQLPKYVLRQVRGPSRAQGLKQLGFSRFRVVNGDPAQFGSGQTRGINAVTQFVYPRAEAAHIVFEAQFAEDLQCAGGEHMCGRVGRRGHASFDDEGVDSVFGEQQCGCRSGRTGTDDQDPRSAHVTTRCAEFGVHHRQAPACHGIHRHRPFQPAIAGVYI